MKEFLGSIVFVACVTVFIALPVMWLWNWLLPALFGFPTITFLQALGLQVLCSFLFKANFMPTHNDKD